MTAIPAPGAAFAGRTFDAVLFDMDGTLVDSVPAVDRSWRRMAAEHGIPDPDEFAIPHGTPARTVLAAVLPPDRVDAAFDRLHELELTDDEGVTVLPGARDALAALPEERRAIVTSCTAPLAAVRVRASGLAAPAVLVTADDVERGKPDPDPFLLGARRLGVDPARCLVVEDAPAGIAAARAAGCAVLAVTGTHSAEELAATDPAPDALAPGLVAVRLAVGPDGVRVTDA
ncbi:HAD-IA family hydrolase [Cellulosimicrobium marinum]|uniref:HAD-IA family hydrolase n=1 Tax=Cellulosimicrobium marinum TaxID=1638992 RepID=UPI001E4CCE91|nr:HAD-IA family hydrolase [Cellulosimicrobium marinum]MCB7135278.1 HAD-IA family hydrolase [Cellulosimicrobium marinum]